MITFDPAKDKTNRSKHGVSFADAELADWEDALIWQDDRNGYGEIRLVSLVPIGDRLYCCVYVERDGDKRIISFRKANNREKMRYAKISDN